MLWRATKQGTIPMSGSMSLWPEPEAVPGAPGLVDRSWSLVLEREASSAAAVEKVLMKLAAPGTVAVPSVSGRRVVVRIRSAHPSSADPLEVMVQTTQVLRAVDAVWGIEELQGRPGRESLLLRR